VKDITAAMVKRNDRTCILTAGLIEEGWSGGVDERWGREEEKKEEGR
jgi:hypothetical protein